MRFQIVAIELDQHIPSEFLGHGRRSLEWRLRLFIRHLQEQQIRQLLDVIAVG